jgi:hypothetical protein
MNITNILSLFTGQTSTAATTHAGLTLSLTTTSTMMAGAVAGGVTLLLACQSFSLEHVISGAAGVIMIAACAANLLHLVSGTNTNTLALVSSAAPVADQAVTTKAA